MRQRAGSARHVGGAAFKRTRKVTEKIAKITSSEHDKDCGVASGSCSHVVAAMILLSLNFTYTHPSAEVKAKAFAAIVVLR